MSQKLGTFFGTIFRDLIESRPRFPREAAIFRMMQFSFYHNSQHSILTKEVLGKSHEI